MDMPEITLSDGRVARFTRKPRAMDFSRAYRETGAKGNEIDRTAVILAQIVQIDGRDLSYHEFLALDLDDFQELNSAIPGKSFN